MVDARYYRKCSDSQHTFSTSGETCHQLPDSTVVNTQCDDKNKLLEDPTFSEYSDTDSLASKDELLEIHDTDTDEGFCDNKIR